MIYTLENGDWTKKKFENFVPIPEKFLLVQKLRLEFSRGPLGVKSRIQSHLGVGNGEKHPLGQNCPKADATVKGLSDNQLPACVNFSNNFENFNLF